MALICFLYHAHRVLRIVATRDRRGISLCPFAHFSTRFRAQALSQLTSRSVQTKARAHDQHPKEQSIHSQHGLRFTFHHRDTQQDQRE